MRKKYAEHLRLIPFLTFGFSLVLLFASLTSSVQAASPITGSGLNTQVSPPVPLPSGQTQYNITGGTRPGGASGTNLFHSFGDFNVPTNNIANFLNDSGLATSNILGRVTGGNISNIFGTIQTTGFGNANLFLMNPAGFLFGPNATVNVGGMVSFTFSRLSSTGRRNTVQCHSQYNRRRASKRSACGRLRLLRFESWSDYRSRQPIVRHARAKHLAGRREHHRAVWRT